METEHIELVRNAILDEDAFVRAVFSGRQHGHTVAWRRVVLRPVVVREARHIQCTYSDGQQDTIKNWRGAEAAEEVESLLSLPFSNFYVETGEQRLQVQVTRRGKVVVHRHRSHPAASAPSLEHDRQKDLLFPVGEPDQFLERIGVTTSEGKVRPKMRRKFRQVNEFLKLILETGELEGTEGSPLRIVDCGCGSAQLSLAMYHYLTNKLGQVAHVTGIDVRTDLLGRLTEQCGQWGWNRLDFVPTRILDYVPPHRPNIVLALHACDTASDEALAQAVRWQSEMIFCVPCCHHHLQQQMTPVSVPPELRLVARHGALTQRLGDILTDGLRAQILRILGYRADVVEFISTEHTAKNLMIRAVRSVQPGSRRALEEYRALVDRWQVKPFLAELLEEELADYGVETSAVAPSPDRGATRSTG